MPTTYERAPKAIEAMVQHALEKYHPELHTEGVTIDVMIAHAQDKDEEDCRALKKNGYPIYANTQVTSLVDRARGIADAKLTIDGYEWNRMPDSRRVALIDHELEHLDLARNKPTEKNRFDNSPKRDDLGRPKLKTRPHDWEMVGFQSVAERHPESSHERAQFQFFRDRFGQLNMFGPSVLQIAEGSDTKKNGISRVEISTGKGKNKKILFEGTDKEFHEAVDRVAKVPASKKSKACRARHHASCKSDGCLCECHKGESAHV